MPIPMLPDHGPPYLETDLSRFPVEPWATWSEFLFLAVILYWAWKIRRDPRSHAFIALAIHLLIATVWALDDPTPHSRQ